MYPCTSEKEQDGFQPEEISGKSFHFPLHSFRMSGFSIHSNDVFYSVVFIIRMRMTGRH